MTTIKEVVKGSTPTLLEASKANEVIKALNSLLNITIEYSTDFDVTYGSNGVSITIPEPEEQTEVTQELAGDSYGLWVCENGIPVYKQFLISNEL